MATLIVGLLLFLGVHSTRILAEDVRGQAIVRLGEGPWKGIYSLLSLVGAASYRDLLRTLEDIEERQRIAAAQGDDTDVLAYHAEPPLVAANLFHLRGGRVVDRREFYWEDLEEFDPAEFVPSLLKQLYLEAEYLPKQIHVPVDFEDRETLQEILAERAGHKVEIFTPQRGHK